MSELSITRMVVGPPRSLALGRPVGEPCAATGGAREKGGLRLRLQQGPVNTGKVGADIAGIRVRLGLQRVQIKPRKGTATAVGAIACVALAVALTVALRPTAKQGVDAPLFGPAQPEQDGLTVLAQPYVAVPTQDLAPAAGHRDAPLPASIAPLPPPPQSTPKAPVNNPPPPAASTKRPPEETALAKPAAVVLDEVAAAPNTARPAAAVARPHQVPAAPQKLTGTERSSQPSPPQVPPKASPALESPKGKGLVAITPDGKVAVFTNPTTRMPEQFKVGDKLPSGDTVKAIDVQSGRVVTTAKEYGLE